MASWWKRAGRQAAVAALGAVLVTPSLLASCTPRSGNDAAQAQRKDTGDGERSALSAFLAGRLAQAHGDTRAAAEYYVAALRHDPENVDLLQRAFTLLVAEGRMDEAWPLADRLLTFDSDAPVPLLVAGLRDARDGRFAEAEARFNDMPKRGVFGFLAPLLAAWAKAGAGQTDQALETLAPLAAVQGLGPMRAFHAGLISDIAGRTQAAEDNYKVALEGPLSIRSVEAAGAFYQRDGKPEQARELYARYSAEHPESLLFDGPRLLLAGPGIARPVADSRAGMAEALFDMASVMRQGNALDMAMLLSRLTLAMQPDFGLARMNVADILSSQSRFAEANDAYRQIPAAAAAAGYGRLRIAMNLEEMGDTEAALKELDDLARARPASLDALITKGDVLRRKLRFAEAAEAYDTALRRLPKVEAHHWPLLYSRGVSYERSGAWPKAQADFLRALELKPDQPDVLNYLGYSWIDKGERLDEARAMIEKAVSLRPRDGAVVDSLGWALYRMGEYQNAVKALERAVELKPEDPTINDHLGDAYFQVGRFEEANFQWKRALTLNPEAEQLAPLQDKIRTGAVPAKSAVK